jgi:hypothetical protein
MDQTGPQARWIVFHLGRYVAFGVGWVSSHMYLIGMRRDRLLGFTAFTCLILRISTVIRMQRVINIRVARLDILSDILSGGRVISSSGIC